MHQQMKGLDDDIKLNESLEKKAHAEIKIAKVLLLKTFFLSS